MGSGIVLVTSIVGALDTHDGIQLTIPGGRLIIEGATAVELDFMGITGEVLLGAKVISELEHNPGTSGGGSNSIILSITVDKPPYPVK